MLRKKYINYKEKSGSNKNDVLVTGNLPFYTKYFLIYKSQLTVGWTCNTVRKVRFSSSVGREMPPNMKITVQYINTDLRETGYVAVRLKDMSSLVQGRTFMFTVYNLLFLSSTSSLISKTCRRDI